MAAVLEKQIFTMFLVNRMKSFLFTDCYRGQTHSCMLQQRHVSVTQEYNTV